ncbi:MAG: hypothetical protein NW237_02225 [Cyanobacteriota bacterium]|nr:hypothetical protein [Cyanobacteriota bacterium]
MTIQQIIQTALMTGLLTSAQEHELNVLLFKDECTASDMFLLSRLNRSLLKGSVVQVDRVDVVAIGNFGGSRLRLLPTLVSGAHAGASDTDGVLQLDPKVS